MQMPAGRPLTAPAGARAGANSLRAVPAGPAGRGRDAVRRSFIDPAQPQPEPPVTDICPTNSQIKCSLSEGVSSACRRRSEPSPSRASLAPDPLSSITIDLSLAAAGPRRAGPSLQHTLYLRVARCLGRLADSSPSGSGRGYTLTDLACTPTASHAALSQLSPLPLQPSPERTRPLPFSGTQSLHWEPECI